jgi:hypothetical protein
VDFGFGPNQPRKITFSSLYLVACGFLRAKSNVATIHGSIDQHLSPTLGWLVSGVRRAAAVYLPPTRKKRKPGLNRNPAQLGPSGGMVLLNRVGFVSE